MYAKLLFPVVANVALDTAGPLGSETVPLFRLSSSSVPSTIVNLTVVTSLSPLLATPKTAVGDANVL